MTQQQPLNPIEQAKIAKETAIDQWIPRKKELAKEFIQDEAKQKARNLVKGSVHLCELGENIGSEQSEERPVIIVSNDRINSTSTNVKIIPLSKTLKTKQVVNRKKRTITVPKVKTHFFLMKSKYKFLTYDSAAMAEGITTVSKVRLGKHLGSVDPDDLEKIMSRLKWVFDF
ncbi:type II toxin-antitoxin system PemK/MazF family toxin [Metabacillus niabensis]|uniref:type II toxin-antitoxin system PemK/MazF family toxin n=1 Tax=Metabacillus niabensis TaxID=324854 RepID=UPI001CFB5259|nr:type II toxin-antitoxin system PemK/MazF family toxin [Metabacillus niabensis]